MLTPVPHEGSGSDASSDDGTRPPTPPPREKSHAAGPRLERSGAPGDGGDDATTRIGPSQASPIGAVDAPPTAAAEGAATAAFASATTGFPDFTQLTGAAAPSRAAGGAQQARTGPLAPGQIFGRYHIIRVLGAGGMGAVYHAWDGALGATVALKVIRPEAMRDPQAEHEMERRFKQELVLARKVTHKNVVRIHDLGEIDGIKFISMPYLDGSDLASVLKERGGTLPVPEALRIVRDVAAGLVAAHDAGIVHRDLKPANIMVQQDQAIIMDFGIARSTGAAQEAPFQGIPASVTLTNPMTVAATMAGTIVGTVQYMAPEQATGQPVDQRADIYALGLIFSDLLIGRPRGAKADESALEELRRRLEKAPPRVRTVDPSVPSGVDDLIARCLNPDPAARFQTSAELVAALNRLDASGETIRMRRVVGIPVVTAIAIAFVIVVAALWWYYQRLIPAPQLEPMNVVIADFENRTNDRSFERTLEPMLRLWLQKASFISAYDRSNIRLLTSGGPAPATFRADDATKLAVAQGVGVVITGVVEPQNRGFGVSLRAVNSYDQKVLASVDGNAGTKEEVLSTVEELAEDLRGELGDDTTDSRFFSRTSDPLTTASLDVVRQYAIAMDALSNSRNDEAFKSFERAVSIDPKFGLAYAGMAITSRNLDRQQDAVRWANEALRYLDSMTEREQLRTRGLVYLITADYPNCKEEYQKLIARYPADAAAHNNLALCATHMRDFDLSLASRRQAARILPRRSVYRFNLAIDSTYAGRFAEGDKEARETQKLGNTTLGAVALAFAQLALGRVPDARATYEQLAKDKAGTSRAWSGLGEIAAYEGRYAEAERLFSEGAQADLAAGNVDRAADKLAALAHVHALRGNAAAARAAAQRALEASTAVKIRFLTGRVFAETGDIARAQQAAAALLNEPQKEPRALGKALEGVIALAQQQHGPAIDALEEATRQVDAWIARFDLGRAYLAAGLLTQADSEFGQCVTNRGEALSLFLDDEPTFGYLPAAYYYQGRVREELKTAAFADHYRTYLAIRGAAGEDPLLAEVQRRAGGR